MTPATLTKTEHQVTPNTSIVFVRNMWDQPIDPTYPGKAYRLVRDGRAKPVCAKPYTIKMVGHCGGSVQSYTAGEDVGFNTVGISVINARTGHEVLSLETELQKGQKGRNADRASYRRQRRSRLRHRKPRFDNRKKQKGWLAPSIQHKLDTHVKLITNINSKVIPIKQVVVEGAQFDIQKIKNPEIESTGYN